MQSESKFPKAQGRTVNFGAEEPSSSAAGGAHAAKQKQQAAGALAKQLAEERKRLPIFSARQALIEAAKANDNLVIVGETGSGKTTQLPQYLLEAGFARNDGETIAVTQPRRVAAITVAKRVAQERGCKLGSQVGYTIRFDDVSSAHTKIKYLTDGEPPFAAEVSNSSS